MGADRFDVLHTYFENNSSCEYALSQLYQAARHMSFMRKAGESLLASWIFVFLAFGITLDCWHHAFAVPFFTSFRRPSVPIIVIPFEYVRGHIFLRLDLDGAGPRTILLDTGFISSEKTILLDSSVAGRLRLRRGEKLGLSGIGMNEIVIRKSMMSMFI